MSMEDPHALEDEERSSSVPPTTALSLIPLVPSAQTPNFTSETAIKTKAVSMASTDCISALSSPAEASPAKATVTSPTINGTVKTSPATSHIASASDSLTCTDTSLVNISESSPLSLPALASTTFGSPDQEADFPAVLTFKGVGVTLENNSVWKQFNGCGTEMILTKQGRRMFPYCRYRLAGLDPKRQYNLVLSIVPSDNYRYRWNSSKWEVHGQAEHQAQGLIRAFSHHYSPCLGSEWMSGLVSFYKLKLTNNPQDQDGHIILHSMHRYIPRLHVIPLPDGDVPSPDKPVVMGPESMTFTFPQTEFMAVTTYQNFRITQLKINHNPFAKGFREDGNNSRLNRITTQVQTVLKADPPLPDLKPAALGENKEEAVDLSTKNDTIPASIPKKQEPRLVLKPIMSTAASKDELYVPCIRGTHALGELVLVQKRPRLEPKEETREVNVTPKATPTTPRSTTPGSSPGYHKRRKRINRRWANSRGREWKAAAASPTVVHSPSLTVAMQPELDDVEGLLFVSFSSKEALEVHVRDKPAIKSSSASPISPTTQMQLKKTVEVSPETGEKKITHLEARLLQDLRVLKHRQVIHPVLQEVGLKLSSLDPSKSVDLQYLGVPLPIPPPNPPEQGNTTSPTDEGLPFISRTGKTSDITKIKGWKNKFIRSKEASPPKCDGLQKNLAAFCSNMLDEYLESEAQCISERAAAFSTNPEGSVAYQLPAKSSSYVKTLDSVLKHRNAASRVSDQPNKPCPLSHKPLLYSTLTSPAPPLASLSTTVEAAEAQTNQQSAASRTQPGAESFGNAASGPNSISSVSQRSSAYQAAVSQKSSGSFGQSQGMTHRMPGLTKFQLKLLQMEIGAFNQGLSRTQLTADRLSVALSVMLTKEMLPSQVLKVAQYPKYKGEGSECGQEFCRLGCVCSSLQQPSRGPNHCCRPECMFGCACFKGKITKQLTAGESEQQNQHVYSMTNVKHVVQPHPRSRPNKLWKYNIHDEDSEPLFAPKSAPLPLVPIKNIKRSGAFRPTQPIREEDKDPVYKYLESMMTCARVREFNSKPPPEVTIEPKFFDTSRSSPSELQKPQNTTTDNQLNTYQRTTVSVKKADEKPSPGSNEDGARKQIEIQSACQWDKDRTMVLETLCRRLHQNRLSRRFYVGPYCIRLVTKIFMRKPSGSRVTYRVHISKPSRSSDIDDDEFDDSEEEKQVNQSLDEDLDAEGEGGQFEEAEMQVGVTPFMSGLLPAGRLRASTKPVGCQAYGLIQVNDKSYNQARLLLGCMGSLHPANRLAAYVTGRLIAPADVSHKLPRKSDPKNKINIPGTLRIKAAGTVVPPIITARKTTELKTPTKQKVQLSQTDLQRKGSITLPQTSQNSSSINSMHSFVSAHHSSVGPYQNSSTSSPVSLTVSPSLKTPSFLGHSGTYSFRICPPANQGTRSQNLPGVSLPGGFTLIQLPKPGANGAVQQSESMQSTNTSVGQAPTLTDALSSSCHLAADSDASSLRLGTFTEAMAVLDSRSVELVCDEKMPSDESDDINHRVDASMDIVSEDLSSDSSDYYGEGDDDVNEELVDIETVEEVRQGLTIAKMKEAAKEESLKFGDSSNSFGPEQGLSIQDQMDDGYCDSKDKRRKNHTALERQRRSEQRTLFDKLQTVLKSDPKAPRLRLLSLALKEIQNLVETSKCLEEKKRRLTRVQSLYVKELSLLSGKSDQVIKHKVKEICDRQKMREKTMKWRPFFSHLLQSRAALLQGADPQSKPNPASLLQTDFCMAPSQANPHTTAAQDSVDQTPIPTVHSLPQAVPAAAKVELTVPSPKAENQPDEPEASPQINTSSSQMVPQPQISSVAASLQVTAAQVGALPTSSVHCSKPLALPLIRSKTGRIILPSSLKPIGNGLYTLTVMKPKQNGEDSEVNIQPLDSVLSKNPENTFSKPDHPSDAESGRVAKDKTGQSLNSEAKCSGTTVTVAQAVETNHEGDTGRLKKTQPAACLSFKPVRSGQLEPKASAPVVPRGRGRPRKNPVIPVGEIKKTIAAQDSSKTVRERLVSVMAERRRNEKIILAVLKSTPVMVVNNPVAVKRRRGRPPKSKSVQSKRSPPYAQAGKGPSQSKEDSLVKLSCSFKSPDTKVKQSPTTTALLGDMNTSRPLTRGALGKDFPSAKKRSWIDIEKELEPDLESE